MHRITSRSKRWQNYMNCTHTILQIWLPATTSRPQKNAPGKEIWLQWRRDIGNWYVFWDQRQIVLQKRHQIVREALELVYHPRRRLCWWIMSNFAKRLFYLIGSGLTEWCYIYIYIYIIMSRHQRRYPWPSPASPLYRPSLPVGLQGYNLYRHKAVVCRY